MQFLHNPVLKRNYLHHILRLFLYVFLIAGIHLFGSAQSSVPEYAPHRPKFEDEFVGPFKTWANVKTQHGAKGDGVTDDTRSFQKAIDSLSLRENDTVVLYIPKGNYRITNTLHVKYKMSISIIGQHPDSTIMYWAGPVGKEFLYLNGVAFSKFSRFSLEGNNKAAIAIRSNWDGITKNFVKTTFNEFSDLKIRNVKYGFHIGDPDKDVADEECQIFRTYFKNITEAAIRIESQNALDWHVWDSKFENCKVGIFNAGGQVHVYQSVFLNSTFSDIVSYAYQYLSIRNNFSKGSNRFLDAPGSAENVTGINVQGNKVVSSKYPVINFQQVGPLFLLDNVFKLSIDTPIVLLSNRYDAIAVGNKFTNRLFHYDAGGIIKITQNGFADRSSISEVEPLLPTTPVTRKRKVFEIGSNATAASIQDTINNANQFYKGKRPVIHIGKKVFLNNSLVFPVGSDIQLVGDGMEGPIPVLEGAPNKDVLILEGPSNVTIRDLHIKAHYSNPANAIVIKNVDQQNSKIFIDQFFGWNARNISFHAKGIDHTKIELRGCNAGGSEAFIKLEGGSLLAQGQKTTGRVAMIGGNPAGTSKGNMYFLRNGKLIVQDVWYEGHGQRYNFVGGSGSFTLQSAHYSHGSDQIRPYMQFSDFRGKVALINCHIDNGLKLYDKCPQSQTMGLGLLSYNNKSFSFRNETLSSIILNKNRIHNSNSEGSDVLNDTSINIIADQKLAFIDSMLYSARTERTQDVDSVLQPGITNVRLFRINTTYSKTGILAIGNESNGNNLVPSAVSIASTSRVCHSKITWRNVAGCKIDTNSITKTLADTLWGTAAAETIELFNNGEYIQTQIKGIGKARAFGLIGAASPVDNGIALMSYSLRINANGNLFIYEKEGSTHHAGPYSVNDVLRIAILNNKVHYFRNNELLYVSSVTPVLPLRGDFAIKDEGGSILNVVKGISPLNTLTAVAQGGSSLRYHWFKNNKKVSDTTVNAYSDRLLAGDKVYCIVSSNPDGCTEEGYIISNELTITAGGTNCSGSSFARTIENEETSLEEEEPLILQPNPAEEFIVIQFPVEKKALIQVRDVDGTVLKEMTTSESKTSIDVSTLKSGFYTITTSEGRKVIVKKLIKR